MLRVCLLALAIPFLINCSGEDTIQPVNQAPNITFTFDKKVVAVGTPVNLSVSVSDMNEDDVLTVSWSITNGTLVPLNAQNTEVTWTPPATVGMDTVSISVSDGEATVSVEKEILRGTKRRLSGLGEFRFTADKSPYIIEGRDTQTIRITDSVVVEAGVELYIEDQDLAIEILGTLVAEGTDENHVVVAPNIREPDCLQDCGWWEGFRLISDESQDGFADLNYTEISFARYNINLAPGAASADLRNCKFVCSSQTGIKVSGEGNLTVDRTEISNNLRHGIEIVSLLLVPTSVTVTNSNIRFNGHSGIYIDLRDAAQEADIYVSGNSIKFNSSNGIALANASWASIHNNDIDNNNMSTPSNIRLIWPYPTGVFTPADWDTLDVTNNHWGLDYIPANYDHIENTIWDWVDDHSIGTVVIFDPWETDSQYNP